MQFDLVDLRLIVMVAEARSITHGAARAHLALASASAQIKRLEAMLGVALLIRGRRGVDLTAAGLSLLGHARLILHNVENMRGDLTAYARGLKANVRLLANTSGLSEHLPEALASFLTEHPQVSVDVEECESAGIAAAITGGTADIGLAVDSALLEAAQRFPFCDDRLVLVTSRCNDLAKRRQINFREAMGLDFVGLTNASALQNHIAAQAGRLGGRLTFRARLKDFDAVCQMVAAGIGVAVIPETAAKRYAISLPIKIIQLRDPWAHRKLVICVRNVKSLSRPAQQLVEYLKRQADRDG